MKLLMKVLEIFAISADLCISTQQTSKQLSPLGHRVIVSKKPNKKEQKNYRFPWKHKA